MRLSVCLVLGFLFLGCSPKKTYSGTNPDVQIVRFDSVLYQYLTQDKPDEALAGYQEFLSEYGEKVIGIGRSDSAGFFDRLKNYFSEPTLRQIYGDEQVRLADISAVNAELLSGMDLLLQHFPNLRRPKIYLHVSGWGQNVIVTDDILSLSADKYLGADYPLYQEFFYEYQRQNMSPDRMAPDYLLGFLMSNLPFQGNADLLLDRMIYEGKLRYILSQLLPKRQLWEFVGYTQAQYTWCAGYCDRIWKSVLDNRHLFRPDYPTTSAYFKEAPSTSTLPSGSPGRVGVWLGFQIVLSYMKHYPETDWQVLMHRTDSVEFLKEARFNPTTNR
ncbi:gliding motility lipoprotein GldB [Bacteroidia bacterium]|nr:gliding motility lipoprotein GldB [Bacteroidia bacterium]